MKNSFRVFAITIGVFVIAGLASLFYQQQRAAQTNSIICAWNKMSAAERAALVLRQDGSQKTDWMKLASELAEIDCTACPKEFQAAFSKMVQSAAAVGTRATPLNVIQGAVEMIHVRADALASLNNALADYELAKIELKRVASQNGVIFKN